MDKQAHIIGLSLTVPETEGAPEWLHILPAPGKEFRAIDGRGPWRYDDADALIAASFSADHGPKLFIDVNHSTLKVGTKGGAAPAFGDIVAMEARPDGIWGRVEWNAQGAEMMAQRAYRGFSPVFLGDPKDKSRITRIWHGSMTNAPALAGQLTSLSLGDMAMDFSEIAEALSLGEDVGKDAILAAIAKLKGKSEAEPMTALCLALGADENANVDELAVLAEALKGKASEAGSVAALSQELKQHKAEAWVDGLIADRVGVPANKRDWFVTLHAEDPGRAQEMADMLPVLAETHTTDVPPGGLGEITALTADDIADKAKAYQRKCALDGREVSAAEAVTAVQEGKA